MKLVKNLSMALSLLVFSLSHSFAQTGLREGEILCRVNLTGSTEYSVIQTFDSVLQDIRQECYAIEQCKAMAIRFELKTFGCKVNYITQMAPRQNPRQNPGQNPKQNPEQNPGQNPGQNP